MCIYNLAPQSDLSGGKGLFSGDIILGMRCDKETAENRTSAAGDIGFLSLPTPGVTSAYHFLLPIPLCETPNPQKPQLPENSTLL